MANNPAPLLKSESGRAVDSEMGDEAVLVGTPTISGAAVTVCLV